MQNKNAEAQLALARLSAESALAIQIAALQAAVRALILTSPDKAATQAYFDQLLGQLLVSPPIACEPDQAMILRDLRDMLFRESRSADDLS